MYKKVVRNQIESCLLNAIENEIAANEALEQEYHLGCAVCGDIISLLEQKDMLRKGSYHLERMTLDDMTELLTAYFENGESFAAQRRKTFYARRLA